MMAGMQKKKKKKKKHFSASHLSLENMMNVICQSGIVARSHIILKLCSLVRCYCLSAIFFFWEIK